MYFSGISSIFFYLTQHLYIYAFFRIFHVLNVVQTFWGDFSNLSVANQWTVFSLSKKLFSPNFGKEPVSFYQLRDVENE